MKLPLNISLLFFVLCAVIAPIWTDVQRKCFEDLGCFEITSDFINPFKRLINADPNDRDKVDTKFLLYNRRTIKQFKLLVAKDKRSVQTSDFNSSLDTVFIVAGFEQKMDPDEWMYKMKNEFLMLGNYNVIIVDWRGGNKFPYFQAVANSRLVGAEIALLVNFMKDFFQLKPEKVHIIGHSLGAHIAGYAGEKIHKLGRITALDPAEPYFSGLPPSVRIDPTDATFVDAIHSDMKTSDKLGLGMAEVVGHVDFFPNNGRDHPACSFYYAVNAMATEGLPGAYGAIGCNHMQSIEFFMDSINNQQCEMIAHACDTWESFEAGNCTTCGRYGEKCALMGLRSLDYYLKVHDIRGNPGPLFMKTADKSPFCVFHYQISLKIKDGIGKSRKGNVLILLNGDKASTGFIMKSANNLEIRLNPGDTITFVATTQVEIGRNLKSAKFYWETRDFEWFETHSLYVESLTFYPMTHERDAEKKKNTVTFCPDTNNEIFSKDENVSFNVKC